MGAHQRLCSAYRPPGGDDAAESGKHKGISSGICTRVREPIRVTRCLSLSRLGTPGCGGGERIVRPGMFWIAAAHLGTHGGVAAAPESGQVAGQLHRPLRRREQFDRQRDSAAGNYWMAVETEKLLDADRDLRAA